MRQQPDKEMNDSEWLAIEPYDSPILEPMNEQPKDLMTLEEVIAACSQLQNNSGPSLGRIFRSASHHLEAGSVHVNELRNQLKRLVDCTDGHDSTAVNYTDWQGRVRSAREASERLLQSLLPKP
jgi:hypothetical protein